jgi:hypothetical protein
LVLSSGQLLLDLSFALAVLLPSSLLWPALSTMLHDQAEPLSPLGVGKLC